MAALLTFHILGLYPVPATRQLLIGSPLVSSYVLKNNLFQTETNLTVQGFDHTSLSATPPTSSRLFLKSITINGTPNESLCWISFDVITGGGNIVIEVDSDSEGASARGCGNSTNALPDSLETGGFSGV